jgi:antitoxin (DNA-binding transcriptional repressor) of toxin-antitoxin stability system
MPLLKTMEKISLVEFRQNAEAIIQKVRQGKRFLLTYKGKPVMRLEPIVDTNVGSDDPFYGLGRLWLSSTADSATNEEIDQILYND